MSGQYVRVVTLVWSAVIGAAFCVPLTAAFFGADVPPFVRALIGAGVVVSAVHPLSGLVALAIALPFAASIEVAFGGVTAVAITDALVLTFVAGASVRLVRFRFDDPSRLAGAALVLLAAVATSTLVELSAMQAVVPRQPLFGDLWRHLTIDYWAATREFVVVHLAIRWTAWIALAVYAERVVRRAPDLARMGVRLWVVVGITGAALTISQLLEIILRSELPALTTLLAVMQTVRFSVLHPDVNAAGSYFALFLMPAVIVGVRRRSPWILGLAVPLLVMAFAIGRSRTAIVAVVLLLCWAGGRHLFQRADVQSSRFVVRLLGVTTVVLVGAMVLWAMSYATTRSHVSPGTALQMRLEMAEVGLKTTRRYPVFGVGLGEYARVTRRFTTPATPYLLRFAPNGENAHNNFLQIAVELGIPAALVFIWLVVPVAALGLVNHATRPSPELEGMAMGLSAFLVTAVLGHPLLIAQVGAAFFVALGITAGLAPARAGGTVRTVIVHVCLVFYGVSLAWRLS